ncbi:MAG: class I SAM-dependent methyltransferase, partial [Mycolicibacterium frederiksbergense]|nr:class I SAM-dependent methyltransferase [Mycolicibacterium frederiksbergense]
MARTDGDTWDLASSVGATATMVAAARAMASAAPDPVINDQFAAPLVRAVGVDFFTKLVDGELTEADLGDDPQLNIARFADGMAARTRFFDDFFDDAGAAGVRQAVILAAGLDARAYRLPWADGTVVYEVDQPDVIEFKTLTLADLGASPTAERRTVPIDLREDWPAAMRAAGLDPERPTAWCAEGLLIYLPQEAQDRLFDNIHEL